MASTSTNVTFAGNGNNHGLQVGHNSGAIHVAAPERAETPPPPSCLVPFRRDADFVDRGTLLDQIGERCTAPASRVALVGLGGVGKSQLAIEHCYRTTEQSPQTWVFWVHASNTTRLEEGFREIAEQVKVRGRKDPRADIFKLVHDWLRDARNGPWLLVLDNADDAAVFPSLTTDDGSNGALKQHLSSYLPSSRHSSVLVTSRTKRAAMQLVEDSEIILIEPMNGAAAHVLLRKKLRGKGHSDGAIAELAATLDYMPLALVQAAAYIREREPRCSVQHYLDEYRQSDSRKTSLLNQAAGHLRRDETAKNSVLITWQISFDHIHSTRQSATDLLSLMCFFDRQGIHEDLLHSQDRIAKNTFEDDLVTLRDYSFITVTREEKTFEMHGLVQLAMRTWLGNQGQLDQWRTQFISNLCAELPEGEYEDWEKCQALFPHARAALTQRPDDTESLKVWALLLFKAAWYAYQQGRAGEAEEMAVVSMEVRKEALGEENAETLSSMEVVGLARWAGGRYKEAEAMNRQTLALKEKVLGSEHPLTLTSMSNLALILDNQGKYKEAEAISRQTLAQRERILGPEHLDTLTTMNNLASVLDSQGEYEEAEAMNRQIQAQREKVLGPEHPDTLMSMSNLAHILYYQGKYKEAEVINRQILAQREKVLGPEHPDTLTSMSNLAIVLNSQGQYKEAETIYRWVLAQEEKVLRPEHPLTLTSMNNLALVLDSQGKYKEAETIYRWALAQKEKVLGPEHPDTLISMNNLALVLDNQGKYKEAEVISRQVLAQTEKVLGPKHLDTLYSVHSLAHILASQHRYEESLVLYKRACTAYQTVLGTDHPTTRDCREDYNEAILHSEQAPTNSSAQGPESTTQVITGKASWFARRLAKIGIKRAKESSTQSM